MSALGDLVADVLRLKKAKDARSAARGTRYLVGSSDDLRHEVQRANESVIVSATTLSAAAQTLIEAVTAMEACGNPNCTDCAVPVAKAALALAGGTR